jgi:hypothetical protein
LAGGVSEPSRRAAAHGFEAEAELAPELAEEAAVEALLVAEADGREPSLLARVSQLVLEWVGQKKKEKD